MDSAPRPALVFLNPRAGAGQADTLRFILSAALEQYGYAAQWIILDKGMTPGDVIPLVKLAEKSTRVFTCGGDGTASLVASAIITAGLGDVLPLAVFPSGTANSLARELGIPGDWAQAAQFLCSLDTTVPLDAMQMGDKFYFLRIGAGLDAETIGETSRSDKIRLGRWAYFKSFLARVFRPKRIQFRCIVDGRRRRFWAIQVFVANGGSIALAPFRIGPNISLCDGLLNVCAYDALSWWDYFTVGWKLFRRDYQNQPLLKFWTVRHAISISSQPHVPVQGDGEAVTRTPVNITLVSSAIRVIGETLNSEGV